MVRIILLGLLVFWGTHALAEDSRSYLPTLDMAYEEARAEFRKKAAGLIKKYPQGVLRSHKIPSDQFQDLSMETLYLPAPEPNGKLVVISSGIHGAEAPVGTMGQMVFMDQYAEKVLERGAGVLLVHTLNPYGYKTGRRVDEENRDLNRNFDISKTLFREKNIAYGELSGILNPQGRVENPDLEFYSNISGLVWRLVKGASTSDIRTACVGGQYHESTGIYFGGSRFSPQVEVLKRIYKQYVSPYSSIMHLDFHTGLGKQGVLHLILGKSSTPVELSIIAKLFPKPSPSTYELTTAKTPGFYEVTGDVTDFMRKVFPQQKKKILAMTAEFGTVGASFPIQLQSLHRIIQENQGHHFGYKNEQVQQLVKGRFRKLFLPESIFWRNNVIRKTHDLFEGPVLGFSTKAK